MKLCATIAEFNPFHNGHKQLVATFSQKHDGTIAIMSGNFVQRGSVAVYDKFARANAAVKNGVDLVIELPVIYSLSSAETFASGAIKTLNALNSVDTLFFGSEEGSIKPLKTAATLSINEPEDFKACLKQHIASGMSYPKALCEAYKAFGIDEAVVSSPNNILGIEYIKALLRTNSAMTPATIKRIGAEHDSSLTTASVASASHIRELIRSNAPTDSFMPHFEYPTAIFDKAFTDLVLYSVRTATSEDFAKIYDCSEDLASRFVAAASQESIDAVIASVKSKNFTESRIRRILWNRVLKNTLSPHTDPTYIRILAMNKRGTEIISQLNKTASLPIVQKGAQLKSDDIFLTEARATDVYNIIAKKPSGQDFRHSPIPV